MQSRKLFRRLQIPGSPGWCQVLGTVALFAFLVQAVTGILLALNYAPAPLAAYDSVRHIMTQVTAGRLLRALHHWGASLMIVVVVLHMIQTFVWGDYKKPREATWIGGVILLLLTFYFGLTAPCCRGTTGRTGGRWRSSGCRLARYLHALLRCSCADSARPLTALLMAWHVFWAPAA